MNTRLKVRLTVFFESFSIRKDSIFLTEKLSKNTYALYSNRLILHYKFYNFTLSCVVIYMIIFVCFFCVTYVYMIIIMHADEGTNVFPPDEDDIAHVFKPLRHMCHGKVVCN